MAMIDFDKLNASLDIMTVLRLCGVPHCELRVNTARCRCPRLCCPDHRCTSIDRINNLWHCHRCKAGGNALWLYANLKALDLPHAARGLCHQLGIPVPYLPRSKDRKPRKPRNRERELDWSGGDVAE